jgi:hypothetical protein
MKRYIVVRDLITTDGGSTQSFIVPLGANEKIVSISLSSVYNSYNPTNVPFNSQALQCELVCFKNPQALNTSFTLIRKNDLVSFFAFYPPYFCLNDKALNKIEVEIQANQNIPIIFKYLLSPAVVDMNANEIQLTLTFEIEIE